MSLDNGLKLSPCYSIFIMWRVQGRPVELNAVKCRSLGVAVRITYKGIVGRLPPLPPFAPTSASLRKEKAF